MNPVIGPIHVSRPGMSADEMLAMLKALLALDMPAIEELLASTVGIDPTAMQAARVELFQSSRLKIADLGLGLSEHLFEDWIIHLGFKPLNPNPNQN
jgi:hypothetical protein